MKTTEDDILKRCPFCGAEANSAILFSESRSGEHGSEVWLNAIIICSNEDCRTHRSVKFKACPNNFEAFDQVRHEVIQLWNTRVVET